MTATKVQTFYGVAGMVQTAMSVVRIDGAIVFTLLDADAPEKRTVLADLPATAITLDHGQTLMLNAAIKGRTVNALSFSRVGVKAHTWKTPKALVAFFEANPWGHKQSLIDEIVAAIGEFELEAAA